MARKAGAAAPPAAPAKGARKRGSKLLALVAALLVLLAVSLWLGSQPADLGRLNRSSAPSVAVGMAAFAAILVWAKKLTWPGIIAAFVAAVVSAGVVVGQGWQPGLGRAMTKIGAWLPPNASSCQPAPAGQDRVTSPGGRRCVAVPKCAAGRAPQWRSDRPTGRCVREPA